MISSIRIRSNQIIVQTPHEEIHIHGGTTLKVSQHIDKQSTLEDKVFRVFGTSQFTQEFFLKKIAAGIADS